VSAACSFQQRDEMGWGRLGPKIGIQAWRPAACPDRRL